jgi:glycerol-3-phosphate dehydrogenase
VVLGSAVSVQIAKSDFLSAAQKGKTGRTNQKTSRRCEMGPEEMKLAEMEKAIYEIDPSKYSIRKEWVMDPPPFIIRRLPDDILFEIYKTKIQHLAKVSELMSQINQVEAEMQNSVAELMGKMR